MEDKEFIRRVIRKVKSHDKGMKERIYYENYDFEDDDAEWVEEPDSQEFAEDMIELVKKYEKEGNL